MNKLIQILMTLSLFALVIGVKNASATVRCETQYGGGQTCVKIGELMVLKQVFDPANNKFVDNLGINDFKFAPDDEIRFKVVAKNTGDNDLTNVVVLDTLPEKLIFADPAKKNDRTITFTVDKLAAGESKEYEVRAKVVATDQLPNQNLVCQVNKVNATSGDQSDTASSQVCVEKKVLPITGPSALPLTVFVAMAISGLFLSRQNTLKI